MELPAVTCNPGVLVVGSGPAGLATAASLKELGVEVALVDRHGVAGGAYSRMYSSLRLSSPSRFLSLPGLPGKWNAPYLTAGAYASYLTGYSRYYGLRIQRRSVARIDRICGGYSVTTEGDSQPERYRSVVVATGMCDSPIIPDELHLTPPKSRATPTILHSTSWGGVERFQAGLILVVGSGMRAVEIAEECARAGVQVVVSSRRARARAYPRRLLGVDLRYLTFPLLRLAPRFLVRKRCIQGWRFPAIDEGFALLRAKGMISLRGPIARLTSGKAFFSDGSPPVSPDVVVLATGYRFHFPLLPRGVPMSEMGYPLVKCSEVPGFPDLFFLGVPCAFAPDSHFIHGMARDSRVVAATIASPAGGNRDGSKRGSLDPSTGHFPPAAAPMAPGSRTAVGE